MNDLEPILDLWRALKADGKDYVLATIVGIEGSSYRRPGTCMLMGEDGRRAGTVSGGCLEAEIAKRAWWLTERGPTIERYSTIADEGERPYGSGCGGVVHLLLERSNSADVVLSALEEAFTRRSALAVATALEGPKMGLRGFFGSERHFDAGDALRALAEESLQQRACVESKTILDDTPARAWACFHPARTGLWVFSAGDDAKPLTNMARELGWWVAVADGRAHLATPARFPSAHKVCILPIEHLPAAAPSLLEFRPTDAAIVMTHSFEQDSHILASLLGAPIRPGYIGVLGPQRRTRELLAEAARLLGRHASEARVDAWIGALHAPTGLDLEADTPAAIALSILSEVQKVLAGGSAKPLNQVRAALPEALHS
jgi:xanthine dehydrogenase accessory factor